jgi:hypothetical protein
VKENIEKLPSDLTPFERAANTKTQETNKATANLILIPFKFSMPLVSSSTLSLNKNLIN